MADCTRVFWSTYINRSAHFWRRRMRTCPVLQRRFSHPMHFCIAELMHLDFNVWSIFSTCLRRRPWAEMHFGFACLRRRPWATLHFGFIGNTFPSQTISSHNWRARALSRPWSHSRTPTCPSWYFMAAKSQRARHESISLSLSQNPHLMFFDHNMCCNNW